MAKEFSKKNKNYIALHHSDSLISSIIGDEVICFSHGHFLQANFTQKEFYICRHVVFICWDLMIIYYSHVRNFIELVTVVHILWPTHISVPKILANSWCKPDHRTNKDLFVVIAMKNIH